jgi:hypothetical protein
MLKECSLKWKKVDKDLKSPIGVSHNVVWKMFFLVSAKVEYCYSLYNLIKFHLIICYLII